MTPPQSGYLNTKHLWAGDSTLQSDAKWDEEESVTIANNHVLPVMAEGTGSHNQCCGVGIQNSRLRLRLLDILYIRLRLRLRSILSGGNKVCAMFKKWDFCDLCRYQSWVIFTDSDSWSLL